MRIIISFLEQKIKEMSEIRKTKSPTESKNETFPLHNRQNTCLIYRCRICLEVFSSRYAFAIHINKHKKKCVNCNLLFKSWKEVENHKEFCSRRHGRTFILPRKARIYEPKKTNLPYKCQLCNRKYECYSHLYDHQYKRCEKRYIAEAWIVKI
jgi:hypothetical protein